MGFYGPDGYYPLPAVEDRIFYLTLPTDLDPAQYDSILVELNAIASESPSRIDLRFITGDTELANTN